MVSAIIVAAGKGTRMGANVDKLFLEVAGRPVVAHTWQRFDEARCIDEIVLVVRDGMQDGFEELAGSSNCPTTIASWREAKGGRTPSGTDWRRRRGTEIVAIQDAARPCTSEGLIAQTIAAARETGAAVAAQPVTDTIKESADGKIILRTPGPLAAVGRADPADASGWKSSAARLAEVRRRGLP